MLVFFTDFSSQLLRGKEGEPDQNSVPLGNLALLWSGASPSSHQYLVFIVERFKLRIHKQDVLWLQVCVGQLVLM